MSRCSWSESINKDLRYDWPLIVQAVGLDASATLYLFRHSNIARMLLSGAYTKLVGDWRNTSEKMIREHYGRYVIDHGDDLARRIWSITAHRHQATWLISPRRRRQASDHLTVVDREADS
jgi:hypothetical protein